MTLDEPAIRLRGLGHRFGTVRALDRIDLTLEAEPSPASSAPMA